MTGVLTAIAMLACAWMLGAGLAALRDLVRFCFIQRCDRCGSRKELEFMRAGGFACRACRAQSARQLWPRRLF